MFWPPGERFDYSNFGPILLDHAVERVSGMPFADFLREQVFWPLGMTRASVGVPADLEPYVAQWYSAAGGKVPPTSEGVYCSVHDLAMFAMFHLKTHRPDQKQIITDASINAMQNDAVPAGGGRKYGYPTILAQGGTVSDQAWLWMMPDEGIAVVVLTNPG